MAIPEDVKSDMTEAMALVYGNEQVRRIMRIQFAMTLAAQNPGLTPAAVYERVDELMAEGEKYTPGISALGSTPA